MRWTVISRNPRSMMFSHELDVGMKGIGNRGCRVSQARTLACLCVLSLSAMRCRSRWGGRVARPGVLARPWVMFVVLIIRPSGEGQHGASSVDSPGVRLFRAGSGSDAGIQARFTSGEPLPFAALRHPRLGQADGVRQSVRRSDCTPRRCVPTQWPERRLHVQLLDVLRRDSGSQKPWDNALSAARTLGARLDWAYLKEQARRRGVAPDLERLRRDAGI
ncbi:MAG: hypothetical protein FLDDKLPJ_02154 [Phycisphaerae bacterium]|nr:hypothetical protein [Phycisphaerae bacterium]